MGKSLPPNEKPAVMQKGLNNVKNGFVNKKKFRKYKNTPFGKVALVNDLKSKNNQNMVQQQKNQRNDNQISPKKREISDTLLLTKGTVNKNVKQKKKQMSKHNTSNTSINQEKKTKIKTELAEKDDSDSDVLDIFSNSLLDNSEDDDSDFGKEDDNQGDIKENKGVKMFAGINGSKNRTNDNSGEEEDDDDDESSGEDDENMSLNTTSNTSNSMDDEEEETEDEDSAAELGLKALLGNSIQDDESDEDFSADEDDEDDEDSASESGLKDLENTQDDESNEDFDDTDDDGEENALEPGLKVLLGNSIQDDESDEDFNADEDEEDEDISDEDESESDMDNTGEEIEVGKSAKKRKEAKSTKDTKTKEKLTPEEQLEKDRRTIFVGNVPKETSMIQLRKFFGQFGPIDTVRIRGVVPKDPKTPLKVAAIKKETHPKVNIVCAYVSFKSKDSVKKALACNGKIFEGNYIRVDTVVKEEQKKPDQKKAIFLGNLPFGIENNTIWKLFDKCGEIDSVRIIRDRRSGAGIGVGYVNFKTQDAAQLALELNGTKVGNREIRVTPCTDTQGKRKNKSNKRPLSKQAKEPSPNKKHKTESENVARATQNSINAERRKTSKSKKSQGERAREKSNTPSPNKSPTAFQGQKSDKKKKSKGHKFDKKKKILAAKLTAKSKKPMKKNE